MSVVFYWCHTGPWSDWTSVQNTGYWSRQYWMGVDPTTFWSHRTSWCSHPTQRRDTLWNNISPSGFYFFTLRNISQYFFYLGILRMRPHIKNRQPDLKELPWIHPWGRGSLGFNLYQDTSRFLYCPQPCSDRDTLGYLLYAFRLVRANHGLYQ